MSTARLLPLALVVWTVALVTVTRSQTVFDASRGYSAGGHTWAGVANGQPIRAGVVPRLSMPNVEAARRYGSIIGTHNFPSAPVQSGMSAGVLNRPTVMGSGDSDLLPLVLEARQMQANSALDGSYDFMEPTLEGEQPAAEGSGTRVTPAGAPKNRGIHNRPQLRVDPAIWSAFTEEWFHRHAEALTSGRLSPPGLSPWRTTDWPTVAAWLGIAGAPIRYDFGFDNYDHPRVYKNGVTAGDIIALRESAGELAHVPLMTVEGEWLSLGVFAVVPPGDDEPRSVVQLAIHKAGMVRGVHFEPASDLVAPILGRVDPQSQLVAWARADSGQPIVQVGLSSLVRAGGTALVHAEDGWTRIGTLVRLRQPEPVLVPPASKVGEGKPSGAEERKN